MEVQNLKKKVFLDFSLLSLSFLTLPFYRFVGWHDCWFSIIVHARENLTLSAEFHNELFELFTAIRSQLKAFHVCHQH